MTSFKEDFNYPDGDLNGQGGWSGSTSFKVGSNVAYNNYVPSATQIAQKDMDIGNPDIIEFSALIGTSNNHFADTLFLLRYSPSLYIGLGMRATGHLWGSCNIYVIDNAVDVLVANVGSVVEGVLYPISFSFDRILKKYTSITFDGVEYGERSAPNVSAGAILKMVLAWSSNTNVTSGYWDDIDIGPPTAAPTARHRFTGGIQHRALH